MKTKLLAAMFILCMLLASGCQSEGTSPQSTPAVSSTSASSSTEGDALETFLASHSQQDIKNLFSIIHAVALPNIPNATDPFPYYGFKDTSELSSNGLYNFFLNFCDNEEATTYWNEAEKRYYIPLEFVHKTLDKYFADYTFLPEEMTEENGYLPDEKCFITAGLVGHDIRKNGVNIAAVKQTTDRDILIEAKSLELDDPYGETGTTEILVLHPTDTGYLFNSYQIIPAE